MHWEVLNALWVLPFLTGKIVLTYDQSAWTNWAHKSRVHYLRFVQYNPFQKYGTAAAQQALCPPWDTFQDRPRGAESVLKRCRPQWRDGLGSVCEDQWTVPEGWQAPRTRGPWMLTTKSLSRTMVCVEELMTVKSWDWDWSKYPTAEWMTWEGCTWPPSEMTSCGLEPKRKVI